MPEIHAFGPLGLALYVEQINILVNRPNFISLTSKVRRNSSLVWYSATIPIYSGILAEIPV